MDKSKLDGLLSDFYIVSGMEISVISRDFHSVAIRRSGGRNFCSLLHRAEGMIDKCKASDVEHLATVGESGTPHVYTCHAGICEAIVPIVSGDGIVGYLFASMGINTDETSDAEILERVKASAPKLDVETAREMISKMKHLTRREIDAYVGMLLLLAEHIGNDDSLLLGNESIGRQIKYYVKKNLTRKLTLSDIAWNLHCSTVTLTEHFKAEFGITVIEYVTKKRMELAEKLLITTDEPLREIATMTGYSDVEYFSRTFKRYHGTSPAAWRNFNK